MNYARGSHATFVDDAARLFIAKARLPAMMHLSTIHRATITARAASPISSPQDAIRAKGRDYGKAARRCRRQARTIVRARIFLISPLCIDAKFPHIFATGHAFLERKSTAGPCTLPYNARRALSRWLYMTGRA